MRRGATGEEPFFSGCDEDALIGVYELAHARDSVWVDTVVLAELLDLSPVVVAHMARELEEWGLTTYDRTRGLALTRDGRQMARRIKRSRWLVTFSRTMQCYRTGRSGLP